MRGTTGSIGLIIFLLTHFNVFCQGHENWISKISTVEDALRYASKHKDVLVSFVNSEKDVFLFDSIDTSNLSSHVGQSSTLFGRTTKFLKDTMITMVDIQVILFDTAAMPSETIDVLKPQMLKRIHEGEKFWDLKKKYAHTSTSFISGPEIVQDVLIKYNVNVEYAQAGAIYEFNVGGRQGIIIVNIAAHKVPAFYAISYNSGT